MYTVTNWSNRDPIQEQGGLNLYAMVQNNPIDYWDYLGMSTCGKSWWDDAKMYAEAFGEGLLDGVQILADTVNPFDDPFANAGAYDPNNPYNQTSQNIANIATSINPAGLGKAALKTGVKAALSGGAKSAGQTTSRASRRHAMRDQDIPTSQQPKSQSRNASGREQSYEVPKAGGGTQTKSVQQQTMDSSHRGQGHWEAGKVKTDPLTGETRRNRYGRPKLTNNKSKVNYDE